MPSKTIVAIICITIILVSCIFNDIDGALIGTGVAAIAGLGGWAAHKVKNP
ncbi:hypothetical protein ES708_21760 [subsurface metagenome]